MVRGYNTWVELSQQRDTYVGKGERATQTQMRHMDRAMRYRSMIGVSDIKPCRYGQS